MSANLKRGPRTHQKEAHSPLISATNMPTTRSQSKAMSTPPISSVLEEPESPKSTSSQETPWSTQSINNTSPLGNQLSPGWVHAITIIMGKSLQSEVGEMLQKWIHYHLIPDHTEFWFSWDPSDPEDFRLLQKYEESDGSIAYTMLDNQFRGTTQQFVLHFNEQFRRLDDLTDISERMPESIKMALLQNAVKDIPQLSIVETLDEYTSTTCGDGSSTHLNYSSYYNLLINACVRYDATKTSTPSKRRNVYAASGTQDFNTYEESHETYFPQDTDTPTDDFYHVHQSKHSRKPPTPLSGFQKDHSRKPTPASTKKPSASKKYDGPVCVPAEVYKLLSPEAVIALKKYNSEALNKMAKKRGIHVTDITDQVLSIAETNISEEQVEANQDEDEPEDGTDPILDYINSQHHQEDDMNHALQAYNIMTSPFSDATSQRSINSVHTHLLYHVAQAKQAQHGSLVDRGANGGLAGSDVRILSKSSRKCTVTRIDEHQINGLDIVQCAALVKTNHGYVNLIMNEYAYYGKGHTIHSSGQIEWNKNQVDDRSVKVGGSQCITTLDGYSFPLKCTGGLMYLNIMGKPTDEELLKYPSVHLTSIHEWDPSVLD